MTQNQIAYLEAIERHRSNVANEQETHRQNVASLEETIRSHKADEAERYRYNTGYLQELSRSNRAKESYNLLNLQEQTRHNQATEQLSAYSNRIEKYKADNALYLGLGNLRNTTEYNRYQNQLAIEKYNTQKQITEKERKSVELVGSQIETNQSQSDYYKEQAKSERELRASKKFGNYLNPIAQTLRGISPLVNLFKGGN